MSNINVTTNKNTKKTIYRVGTVYIMREGNRLTYEGPGICPEQAVLAILAVAKYLKWGVNPYFTYYNVENGAMGSLMTLCGEGRPTNWPQWRQGWELPFLLDTTCSKSGATVYVGYKPVMRVCKTGNTEWCSMTRRQIRGALNDWFYRRSDLLIPGYVFAILPMLRVDRVKMPMEEDGTEAEA